jgi:hypothetical protein
MRGLEPDAGDCCSFEVPPSSFSAPFILACLSLWGLGGLCSCLLLSIFLLYFVLDL